MATITRQGRWFVAAGVLVGVLVGYFLFAGASQQDCVYTRVQALQSTLGTTSAASLGGIEDKGELLTAVRTIVELYVSGTTQVTEESEPIFASLKGVLDECKVHYVQ